MNDPIPNFYITKGTLPGTASSYVPRAADQELYDRLLAGEYTHILTSRQVGKSSITIRTALRLKAEGVHVIVIDLSSMGSEVTREQWYRGVCQRMAKMLNLQQEMNDFLEKSSDLSPLQMWEESLQEVLLKNLSGPIVFFIDEIEYVRSLKHDTDEFFIAIRSCYNRRAIDPDFERLAFCLIGSCSPADLIRRPDVTPYNIGSRVELTDFSPDEAALLEKGLNKDPEIAKRLMSRVLYWTGGHPYLTQNLCWLISHEANVTDESAVDTLCEKAFFGGAALSGDSNLAFVSNRILASSEGIEDLLSLYKQILAGKRIPDDDTNRLVQALKIAGLIGFAKGRLRVRNRIYQTVFDRRWVCEHMPDAELRRQRIAYRNGMLRAVALLGSILVPVAIAAVFAYYQWQRANTALADLNQSLYEANIFRGQTYWKLGDTTAVSNLVEQHLPEKDVNKENWKRFEWRYLWSKLHQDKQTLRGHTATIISVACSGDGRIASGGFDKTVRVWNESGMCLKIINGFSSWISSVTFSGDSKYLAVGVENSDISIYDTVDWKKVQSFHLTDKTGLRLLDFLPGGKTLFAGLSNRNNDPSLQQVSSQEEGVPFRLRTLWVPSQSDNTLSLFPDFKTAVARTDVPNVRQDFALVDSKTGQKLRVFQSQKGETIASSKVSPDGSMLAVAFNRKLCIYNLKGKSEPILTQGVDAEIHAMTFSSNGALLACACWDNQIRIFDTKGLKLRSVLKGHTERVNSVVFSRDDKTLISGSSDLTVKLWDVKSFPDPEDDEEEKLPAELRRHYDSFAFAPETANLLVQKKGSVIERWNLNNMQREALAAPLTSSDILVAISAYGKRFVTSKNNQADIWEVQTGRHIARFAFAPTGYRLSMDSTVFSPDGEKIVFWFEQPGGGLQQILWNVSDQKELFSLPKTVASNGSVFSPDSRLLVRREVLLGNNVDKINVWDVGRKSIVYRLPNAKQDPIHGFQNDLISSSFSADGNLIAGCDWEGDIRIFDGKNGRPIAAFKPFSGNARRVSFSPDGKTLAVAGENGGIKLFNFSTRREVARFLAKPNINLLSFSTDGTMLFCQARDGIHIWRAPSTTDIEKRRRQEAN